MVSFGLETNLLVAVKCSRGVGWREERRKAAAETGRGGQGSSPSLAHCPRSARFPDSHLQGQDAVVPHKRLAVTTSFKSLSGLPATIKGHVCKGEERGGGKNSWTGGRGQLRTLVTGGAPARLRTASAEVTGLQFTRCANAWQDKANSFRWRRRWAFRSMAKEVSLRVLSGTLRGIPATASRKIL